jgi:teichuronic acid biosynthesis protein TuaE
MLTNSRRLKKVFTHIAGPEWSVWLLGFLIAILIGKVVVSPRLSFPVLGLLVGVAGLLLRLLQSVRIPVSRIEKICCYSAFITGFFGVALFPIDLGPFTLFPYRIFLVLLWGLFVARMLIQGKVVLPLGRVKPYMAFFGIWTIYAVFSLAWATDKSDAIRYVIFLFMGVSLIFFAAKYFRDYRDLRRLYLIWFGVFCVLVLLGFWEHLTGHHLPVSGYYEAKLAALKPYVRAAVMYQPTGVFKNPNDYATFLALSIPFAISLIRYGKSKVAQLSGLVGAAGAFYLIFVTGSRANILSVLLELLVLLLFLTSIRQKAKVAIAAAVCLAIVLVLLPGPVREFSSKVVWELSSIIAQAELRSGSVYIRANLARNGLEFLYSTAGFGVGAGNAEYWMANFAQYDTRGILNPHNWWLEILINYGVFIFIGYVVVYIEIIRKLWNSWHEAAGREERIIAESLLLALIGFFAASISSSSIMAFTPNWMLFAFALAFLNYSFCHGPLATSQFTREVNRE